MSLRIGARLDLRKVRGLWLPAAVVGGAAPTVSAISPNIADPAGGGSAVTITGTNFTGATGVTLGGTAATSVTVVNSTTITCIPGARAAGAGLSVVVTTPSGSNGANTLFEYWSPAQLALTGWWRASYAGTPWSGNASAGGSGSNAMNAGSPSTGYPSTPVAPSVGAALGGFNPAEFNGTTQFTVSTNFTEAIVPPTGYAIAVLFRASSLVLSSVYPNTYDSAGLFADPYGFNFGVDDAGLAVAHFDSGWNQHRLAGVSVSTWTLGQVRYDGTTVRLRLNGGAWSAGIAAASLTTPTSTYRCAAGIAALSVAQPFTGRIAEILTAGSVTDANLDRTRVYCNQRYGLSL